jgi:DNA-binding IclR family transcriptional regulator
VISCIVRSMPPSGKPEGTNGPRTSVHVIERAARVLRALDGEHAGLSLSQLSERTSLARSTIHRILSALEAEGFVMAAPPHGRMRLGDELIRLARSASPDVASLARPVMNMLFGSLNETVDLAVLQHDHLRFVDQIATPQRLRAVSAIGATFPLHCTANGKAVLAGMDDDSVVRLLPPRLPRHTPNTIVSRRELLAELAMVRKDGIAFDVEEHSEGICAGSFVLNARSHYVAAISVPIPTHRFNASRRRLHTELLLARESNFAVG